MSDYPFSEARVQAFQALLAVSCEEVCSSLNYAREYMVIEIFLN
jgi:hypothetical protein